MCLIVPFYTQRLPSFFLDNYRYYRSQVAVWELNPGPSSFLFCCIFSHNSQRVNDSMMSMSGLFTPWCSPSKAISLFWWITNPNQVWLGRVMEVYEPQEAPQTLRYVVFALVAVESVLFLGLFLGLQFVAALQLKSPIKCGLSPVLVCFHARFFRMPPERKAFAEKTLWIILLFSILSFTGVWEGFKYETWPTDCYDI